MAEKHEGFVRGSEAYLAGVWYVMKDAEARWKKDQERIAKGRLNPWAFLRKVQQAMGYEARRVPYSVMRADLQEFAETFGVELDHPAAPVSSTNREAQKEFGS